jgi:hypothetical protein
MLFASKNISAILWLVSAILLAPGRIIALESDEVRRLYAPLYRAVSVVLGPEGTQAFFESWESRDLGIINFKFLNNRDESMDYEHLSGVIAEQIGMISVRKTVKPPERMFEHRHFWGGDRMPKPDGLIGQIFGKGIVIRNLVEVKANGFLDRYQAQSFYEVLRTEGLRLIVDGTKVRFTPENISVLIDGKPNCITCTLNDDFIKKYILFSSLTNHTFGGEHEVLPAYIKRIVEQLWIELTGKRPSIFVELTRVANLVRDELPDLFALLEERVQNFNLFRFWKKADVELIREVLSHLRSDGQLSQMEKKQRFGAALTMTAKNARRRKGDSFTRLTRIGVEEFGPYNKSKKCPNGILGYIVVRRYLGIVAMVREGKTDWTRRSLEGCLESWKRMGLRFLYGNEDRLERFAPELISFSVRVNGVHTWVPLEKMTGESLGNFLNENDERNVRDLVERISPPELENESARLSAALFPECSNVLE